MSKQREGSSSKGEINIELIALNSTYDKSKGNSTQKAKPQPLDVENNITLSEVILGCRIVAKMNVPDCIIEEICNMARGVIVKCYFCELEGHLDLNAFKQRNLSDYLMVLCLDKVQNKLTNMNDDRWLWACQFESFDEHQQNDVLCSQCVNKYGCTLCDNSCNEQNYECDECGAIVCENCEKYMTHLHHHEMLDLQLPLLNQHDIGEVVWGYLSERAQSESIHSIVLSDE